ncbi:MAG: flagellar FliJ family protein [Faecalibacterium sp.]|jgi:flagellar FliJ protein|nr:flagellar FliJ family protein [Faecalibacterium sp.]
MKSFVFSMERMRNYKEQLLDGEKGTLRRLRQERDAISDRIAALQTFRRTTDTEFQARQKAGVSYLEIQSFQFRMENARMTLKQLRQELEKANEAVEAQLQVVIQASQEVSGLDKLEEKQQETYRQQANAESREQILEQVSNKESRKRQQA